MEREEVDNNIISDSNINRDESSNNNDSSAENMHSSVELNSAEFYENSHGDMYINRREIQRSNEVIEKLREGIKIEGRTVKEEYNRVEAIRLLMVKLVESLEGEKAEILNGFIADERIKELDEVANLLIRKGMELIKRSEFTDGKVKIAGYIKEAYQVLGRRDFEKFLIAIEWNYPMEMKFYEIRKNVLREWVKYSEDLEYGRLKILSISAPPRSRKNNDRREIFFMVYVKASREELFFCFAHSCNGDKGI